MLAYNPDDDIPIKFTWKPVAFKGKYLKIQLAFANPLEICS